MVVFMEKLRWVVIYVLNFDNEFRRGFQRSVCVPIHSLSCQGVLSSLLPIQCLGCMDVPWFVINNKNNSCSFTWEDVFNVSISRINIWMKLQKEKQTHHFLDVLMKQRNAGNCYHFSFQQQWLPPGNNPHSGTCCDHMYPASRALPAQMCLLPHAGCWKPNISDLRKRIHEKILIAGSAFAWSWQEE